MPNSPTKSRVVLLISLLLALVTLAVYWPVIHCEFINFDDPFYVTDNLEVKNGLTWDNVRWAATAKVIGAWHPLTFISHMLDCQLYGLKPAGHHVTNLLLHMLNSVLVFLVLRRMTGAMWRSAFVAALFALHPLHVESVAWVSERKDVLSTCFWALTIWAYVRYAEKPGIGRYVLVTLLFALGLLAKPMLVTLPFLLLLLDYWPLRRTPSRFRIFGVEISTADAPAVQPNSQTTFTRLVLEKLPLLALSALCSAATIWAQGYAVGVLHLPFSVRLENALLSYFRYMEKMVWPTRLVVIYPFSTDFGIWNLVAVVVVVWLSVIAIRHAIRLPYLFTGWFWFVGTLVPTIGLVQVGLQSMADRYTYVPLIGLFIIIAWGGFDLARRWQIRTATLGSVAALAVAACIPLTRIQLGYWQNSFALFEHALRWTSDNYTAEYNLAMAFMDRGDYEAARKHYIEAIRIFPNTPQPHFSLALDLIRQNKLDEAYPELLETLRIKPDDGEALNNLGLLLVKQGKLEEGMARYREALAAKVDLPELHFNLAEALAKKNKLDEAIIEYKSALAHFPAWSVIRVELARALARKGRVGEAKDQWRALLRREPDNLDAHIGLGLILGGEKDFQAALGHLKEAARINATNAVVRFHLGMTLDQLGQTKEAVAQYQEALRLNPKMPVVLNNLAWILASHPNPEVRNGTEAVRLAEQACELTRHQEAMMVGTLGAAYAEAGRFEQAVEMANQAQALAAAAGNTELAEKDKKMAELFLSRQPFHQSPAPVIATPEKKNP